jgi:D-sedoheptulose 7-phosphate isomerase
MPAMDDIIRDLIKQHCDALDRMDAPRQKVLAAAAELLIGTFRSGATVFVCGNGGSAADSQHIAAELSGRYLRERPALDCIALTTNTSNLTAIGNDYEFTRVFARQVEAHVRAGDCLWAISTSGNSPNILEAITAAKSRGAKVLGFTGGKGGKMASMCDVCFIAPADATYGIQQLHELGYHIICDLVERAFA